MTDLSLSASYNLDHPMTNNQDYSRRRFMVSGAALSTLLLVPTDISAQPKNSLSGQSILITGTSSGFGYIGALHYARLGATVIATMRNLPRPEADELKAIAYDERLNLSVVELDVLKDKSVRNALKKVEKILGKTPDVLINNAGLAIIGPVEAQDTKATRLAFETNVIGYQRLHRAVLPGMRKRGSGRIINMSSQSGRVIWPGLGHYCPTKFAVEAMSEALAYEVEPFGVRVSIIQPGGCPTNFWKNRILYSSALKARIKTEDIKRYGKIYENMDSERIPNLKGNIADVPTAIAHILSMPKDEMPLRVMISHQGHPQKDINKTHKQTHTAFLERSSYGQSVKAIHNVKKSAP